VAYPIRKTIRNSAAPGGIDVKLFSALTHREQVVIAQVAVHAQPTDRQWQPATPAAGHHRPHAPRGRRQRPPHRRTDHRRPARAKSGSPTPTASTSQE
jgi:hypothetical protein